ncbi:MAG: hypothetical protein IPK16_17230 [Anaerolineales bacterium]|nr:hypothetical protein [Anaerolineales bacterium]
MLRLINKLAPDGGPDSSGFNNDEAEVMVSIGTMVAMAIETAIQLHQFGILLRLADETGRSVSNLQDVLNKICFYACSALNADQSGIVLYEPEENIGTVRFR